MPRLWRPLLVGAVVVVATFVLAQARIFEPEASSAPIVAGDVEAGRLVFERACAACHGPAGEGGSGPSLEGSRLDAEQVALQIREGSGVMPAGLVSGQEEADVVAYVVSIGGP